MKMKPILILLSVSAMTAGLSFAETLKVDKQKSRIQVDASATGHAFTGTLADYQAAVTGDAGTMEPSSFKLDWKFKNLKTADEKRDQEMIKWLKEADPAGQFTFVKSWKGKDGKTYAMGQLMIHGVTKDITFPYTVKKDGAWVTIDGSAGLDYTNFKLPVIRSMAVMTVDPKLKVRFHIVGKAG